MCSEIPVTRLKFDVSSGAFYFRHLHGCDQARVSSGSLTGCESTQCLVVWCEDGDIAHACERACEIWLCLQQAAKCGETRGVRDDLSQRLGTGDSQQAGIRE